MEPHDFWQGLLPADTPAGAGPFREAYPARLPDGRLLLLPIRPLPDGRHGLASLIINQASFAVVAALADALAEQARSLGAEVVVGLPTLGLTLASAIAERLGHSRYVPLGTSRKFWYREELSVPLSSVTTPPPHKRLYMDPRMLPLLASRRVLLVDDVMSSGSSMVAGLDLLRASGVVPSGLAVAMLQTERWRDAITAAWTGGGDDALISALTSPLLESTPEGWVAA